MNEAAELDDDRASKLMSGYVNNLDREDAHTEADNLVAAILRQSGWTKTAEAYSSAKLYWWYA